MAALPDHNSLRGGAARMRAAGDMLASGAAGARRFADAVGPGLWVDDAASVARQHAEALTGRLGAGRTACYEAADALDQAAMFVAGRRGRFDQVESRLQQLVQAPAGATLPDWHAEVANLTQERDAIVRDVRTVMGRAAQAVNAVAARARRETDPLPDLHKALGALLSPWSMITARFKAPTILRAMSALREAAAVPARTEQWFEELLRPVLGDARATDRDVVEALTRWQAKADAAEAFTKQWTHEANQALVHGEGGLVDALDRVAAPLAVIDDSTILTDPSASGLHGTVNRVAAGANLAGMVGMAAIPVAEVAGIDASVGWVPVAGEVVIVGSGVYLAGDWAYENVRPFHDFVDTVASGTVSAAESAFHGVTGVASAAIHLF
jgi:hypothetical protein